MTIFVTFALFAIVFYIVAVIMRPSGAVTGMGVQLSRTVQDIIGQVIPDPVARWLLSLVLSLAVMLVPILLLFHRYFRNPLGPDITYGDVMTSVAVSKAVFGILFGLIFAYWFRSLLLTDAKAGLSTKEIVVAVIMIILLLLGAGGQTVLANLFDRLTGFEVGGTKLAFAEGHAQTVTASVNLAYRNAQSSGAPDTSQGLDFLAAIGTFIGRDEDSVEAVTGERPNWKETADFVEEVVSGPARCLQTYVDASGDSSRVAEVLTDAAARIGSAIRVKHTREVRDSILTAAGQVDDFFKPLDDLEHCRALSAVAAAVAKRFEPPADADRWRERPYLWLAAASMFAFGHHYPPAIALLDQWAQALDAHESVEPVRLPAPQAYRTVFEIRVRTALSVFTEEWIRFSPGSKTVAVLDYHLANLQKLLDALNSLSVVGQDLQKVRTLGNSLAATAFASAPDDRGPCPLVPALAGQSGSKLSPTDLARVRLLETFVSTRIVWITTALDHPEYIGQYAAKAHRYLDDLLSMNLSCSRLVAGPDPGNRSDKQPATDRSEMLHLVARIALAEGDDPQSRQVVDPEKTRTALKQARQAVDLGLQIITPFKEDASKGARDRAFLDQIGGDPAVSDYDDLKGDAAKLDDAIAR